MSLLETLQAAMMEVQHQSAVIAFDHLKEVNRLSLEQVRISIEHQAEIRALELQEQIAKTEIQQVVLKQIKENKDFPLINVKGN